MMRFAQYTLLVCLVASVAFAAPNKNRVHKEPLVEPQTCENGGAGAADASGISSCAVILDQVVARLTKSEFNTIQSLVAQGKTEEEIGDLSSVDKVVKATMKFYPQAPPIDKDDMGGPNYCAQHTTLRIIENKPFVVVRGARGQIDTIVTKAAAKTPLTASKIQTLIDEVKVCKYKGIVRSLLLHNGGYPKETETTSYKAGIWFVASCSGENVEVMLTNTIIEINYRDASYKADPHLVLTCGTYYDSWLAWSFFMNFTDQCTNVQDKFAEFKR